MLSPDDRAFFTLVSDAVFANPFGDERPRIDRRLVRAPRSLDRGQVLAQLLAAVSARLGGLERGKRADLRRHDGDERAILEHAVLFAVFHRFTADFDALIQSQVGRGTRPPRVSFARDALGELAHYGFD